MNQLIKQRNKYKLNSESFTNKSIQKRIKQHWFYVPLLLFRFL